MFSLLEVFTLFEAGDSSEDTAESEDERLTDEFRTGAGVVSVEERSMISRFAEVFFGLLKPGVENEGRLPIVFLRTGSS